MVHYYLEPYLMHHFRDALEHISSRECLACNMFNGPEFSNATHRKYSNEARFLIFVSPYVCYDMYGNYGPLNSVSNPNVSLCTLL